MSKLYADGNEPFLEPEKKPLLVNADHYDADNTEWSVGLMDRPFGTSVWRYWALFVFCMLSVVQNIAWIAFSTILDDAKLHYDITTAQINRLVEVATIVFIPGVLIFSPLSDRFGLKAVVIGSSACVCAGSVCRWVGGNSYTWLFVGQAFNGLAGPIIMNAPPQLAAAWFPPRHRATATAVGWSAQCIGVAIGYLIAPILAPSPDDLPLLMKVLGYQGIALMMLSLTFPKEPALAPSASAAASKVGFIQGLRPAMKNWSFVLLALSWAIAGAVLQAWATFLDMFMDHRASDALIGTLGFAGNLMNMAGSIIIPPLVSGKYLQRKWKWVVIVLQTAVSLSVGMFTYFLYDLYPYTNSSNSSNSSNMSSSSGGMVSDSFGPVANGIELDHGSSHPQGWIAMGATFCIGSFFFGGSSVVGLELACEIVFPVSEESAAAYMTLLYMVFNIASMEAGNVLHSETINIGVASLLGMCAILLLPIKNLNKRMSLDDQNK